MNPCYAHQRTIIESALPYCYSIVRVPSIAGVDDCDYNSAVSSTHQKTTACSYAHTA